MKEAAPKPVWQRLLMFNPLLMKNLTGFLHDLNQISFPPLLGENKDQSYFYSIINVLDQAQQTKNRSLRFFF